MFWPWTKVFIFLCILKIAFSITLFCKYHLFYSLYQREFHLQTSWIYIYLQSNLRLLITSTTGLSPLNVSKVFAKILSSRSQKLPFKIIYFKMNSYANTQFEIEGFAKKGKNEKSSNIECISVEMLLINSAIVTLEQQLKWRIFSNGDESFQ